MPNYLYTSSEPRTFPQVPTELDDQGEPVAFAAHDLLEGDVIEAAKNPDESRFEETDLPAGQVARPVEPTGEGDASAPGERDTSRRPSRQEKLDALRKARAEQKAFDALTDDEKATLASLTPEELEALAELQGAG